MVDPGIWRVANEGAVSDTLLFRKDTRLTGDAVLMPADTLTAETVRKLKQDETVELRIVKDRSLPQHRLFWSLLTYVAQNSKWENPERLLVALKIRLGRYDLLQLPNGKTVPVPHSISFAKMEQPEFQKFMDEAVRIICTEVLDGYDSARLLNEAQGYVAA